MWTNAIPKKTNKQSILHRDCVTFLFSDEKKGFRKTKKHWKIGLNVEKVQPRPAQTPQVVLGPIGFGQRFKALSHTGNKLFTAIPYLYRWKIHEDLVITKTEKKSMCCMVLRSVLTFTLMLLKLLANQKTRSWSTASADQFPWLFKHACVLWHCGYIKCTETLNG